MHTHVCGNTQLQQLTPMCVLPACTLQVPPGQVASARMLTTSYALRRNAMD